MRSTPVLALVLILLAGCCCFSQEDHTPLAPRLIIKLPDNIEPEAVWIRYVVDRQISGKESPRLQRGSRGFTILRVRNSEGKPENVKVVMYSPGCEFRTYDLDLVGDADVEERFECDPLPTKTLHGFIPPGELPAPFIRGLEKRLDIAGELDADWICSFFLQTKRGSFAGSCLSSPVPLGTIGTIDPDDQGRFEVTIPDFTHDPVFTEWKTRFGVIETGLRDKKVQVSLGAIKPKDDAPLRPGLNVQADYPDPIIFTRSHN